MIARILNFAWFGFAFALLSFCASGGTNDAVLKIGGMVEHPLVLGLSDLQGMPRLKLTVHEKESEVMYEGAALYEVVNRAKPIVSAKCCSNAINMVVVAKAADNYQAVFSLPELDPKFSSQQILLAYRREGQPLDAAHGPLQIIVPDEKVHARWVRQVNQIEVVAIGDLRGTSTNSPPP